MYKSSFSLIIFLLLLTYIFSDDTINTSCILLEDCDSCIFCGNITQDYSPCNYGNIFCHHTQSNNYEYNTNLKTKYSNHFHNDGRINLFCGDNNILLNSMKDSFTLLKTSSNLFSTKINCDYDITNQYYFSHDSDLAKLHLEIVKINSGNKKIKFDLFMIYKIGDSLRFANLNDENLRDNVMNKSLDKISEIELLIDFNNDEYSVDEYLEISILTENPSKKTKIIYIVVLIICGFLIILIVILIILYICIKRKMENRFRDSIDENIEKEKKIAENKKKIDILYETSLQPQIFTNELLNQNCDNSICSICTDNFEIGKSEVMITPCKHIFHYNCLKPWIDSNILSPKCPNCNYNILDSLLLSKPMEITKKNDGNNKNNNNRGSIVAINNNDNNNGANSSSNNIHDNDNDNNVISNNNLHARENIDIDNRNNRDVNSRDQINN